MPDWFYRTVSRPILFRLPAETARDVALGFLGRLARLPLGPRLIDLLGHMRADPRLTCRVLGIEFPSAVGLGPFLDAKAVALPALARFGLGFLEVGPVSEKGFRPTQSMRRLEEEAILMPHPGWTLDLETAAARLDESPHLGLPVLVRIAHLPHGSDPAAVEESIRIIRRLAPSARLFSISSLAAAAAENWPPEVWVRHVSSVATEAGAANPPRPLLLCVPLDIDLREVEPYLQGALSSGVAGFHLAGSIGADEKWRLAGRPGRRPALDLTRSLRRRFGSEPAIISAGGVHEPRHALDLLEAGADLIQIDTGLVFTGPGLPKRMNDLLLFSRAGEHSWRDLTRPAERSWFWTCMMGLGMLIGSLLTLGVASSRVVLPYDETFVGMSREQLQGVNPRLLSFMAHDRVTLAGTMVAIGVMYSGLSLFGSRSGLHWAQLAVVASAVTGFFSFFLFLGFGYLDPFHAFVTATLFALLLLGIHAPLGVHTPTSAPELESDRAWLFSLWGQFLLILHAGGLLAAGLIIMIVGATSVFVAEDLKFMGVTVEALKAANPGLLPLVAHDRATFGGMMFSGGLVFLLSALWGFRRGAGWLWWTMLISGLSAYAAAIGVHYAVLYTSPEHLLPAWTGLGLFSLGLGLSYRHLTGRPSPGCLHPAG